MFEHSHAVGANSEDSSPNLHFFDWLKKNIGLFLSQVLALLGFIYVPASTIYYVAHLHEQAHPATPLEEFNPYILVAVDGAHIAVLALFIVVLLGIHHKNKEGTYRTKLAYQHLFNETLDGGKAWLHVVSGRVQLRNFKRYFLWFWVAMLALYLAFAFKHLSELPQSKAKTSTAESPVHGNETQSTPMQESATQPPSNGTFDKSNKLDAHEAFGFLLFPFLTFGLNNLSMMFIFWCFLVLYRPRYNSSSKLKHRRDLGFSSFFFFMLTLSYPLLLLIAYRNGFTIKGLTGYATVFDGVSGVLNAVVLALLIARLDSKLIGLPSYLIGLLYFYSAVQPLFAVFEQPGVFQIIQTSVLIIVFGFKVYFFLIIVYALQTGRMLNFLICFPQLKRRIEAIWENQFAVKVGHADDGSFDLSITRKNKKIYTSCDRFKTIVECDSRNAELRRIMERRSSYHRDNQSGTHWVNVLSAHGHKLFYSISLKSEEAAEDLIEESADKIPYCKYDRG
jgi:hypothetical protein